MDWGGAGNRWVDGRGKWHKIGMGDAHVRQFCSRRYGVAVAGEQTERDGYCDSNGSGNESRQR